MKAIEKFVWACSVLREAVDNQVYGKIVVNMQGGDIASVHVEEIKRPVIDKGEKTDIK